MNFQREKAIEILERTPVLLRQLLSGISDEWIYNNEGGQSWSPFDIVGHLIHGERTDWIVRAKIILEKRESEVFEPFDRFAQFNLSKGKSISDLLQIFDELRANNLETLKSFDISDESLNREAVHPDLGTVNLEELLSTWVVHDLGHIAQISRVMAKQYKDNVGPWSAYLSVLHR